MLFRFCNKTGKHTVFCPQAPVSPAQRIRAPSRLYSSAISSYPLWICSTPRIRLSPAAQGSKTVTFRLANGEDGGDIVNPNPDFPIISPNDPGGTYDPGHGEGELRDNWIPLNQDFNVSWTVTCEEEHIPPRRLYDDTRPNPTGDLTRRDANPNTGALSAAPAALLTAFGMLGVCAVMTVRRKDE